MLYVYFDKDCLWKPEGKKANNPFEYVEIYLTFKLAFKMALHILNAVQGSCL